jgi:hypothetical protein
MVATDGTLLDGQTLREDPEVPAQTLTCLPMVDGSVKAGPFNVVLNFPILTGRPERMLVSIPNAWIRLEVTDGGLGSWGYLGGAVEVDTALALLSNYQTAGSNGIAQDISPALEERVRLHSDMITTSDGACTSNSVVFDVEGVQAFIYAD